MSQCTLKSNRPKTIIRKGNDTPLHIALTTDKGDTVDLAAAQNLSVSIVSARTGRAITPPWQITTGGGLSMEFAATSQELGIYGLRIQFDIPADGYTEGLQAYSWEASNLIEVIPSSAPPLPSVNIVEAVISAISKGDKGDPGDPTELLGELSRQQSDRLNEIANAQRESLTSIGARLSDEQRTALEELAGRLSREQSGQIAQQTERLSIEQASGLQVISDRLSSEQTQALERQGQERATAQASALKAISDEQRTALEGLAERLSREQSEQISQQTDSLSNKQTAGLQDISDRLSSEQAQTLEWQRQERAEAQLAALQSLDEQVNRKYDTAIGAISPKVAHEVKRLMPDTVRGYIGGEVKAQLPNQLSESLPSIISLDDQSRLTVGGQPIGGSLRPTIYMERDVQIKRRLLYGQIDIANRVEGAEPVKYLNSMRNADSQERAQWVRHDSAYNIPTWINEPRGGLIRVDLPVPTSSPVQGECIGLDLTMVYTSRDLIQARLMPILWDGDKYAAASVYHTWSTAPMVRCVAIIPRTSDHIYIWLSLARGWIYPSYGDDLYLLEYDTHTHIHRPRGTWSERPEVPYIGQQYIATDMRRNGVGDLPMWYNGQMWIDYEGHDVTRRYLVGG